VEFFAEGGREELEICFDAKALRRFIELGADALTEADACRAREGRGPRREQGRSMKPEAFTSVADDAASHQDGLLMHELTVMNTLLSRYVLRYLDADAGRADPIDPADERALDDRVTAAADGIRARSARREWPGRPRHLFGGCSDADERP
jgi:hypothetical protein